MPVEARKHRPAPAHLIAEGAALLSSKGIEAARFEAKIILAHILGTKPSQAPLAPAPLDPDAIARFRELISERATRRPLQYVIGTHDFMGLTLACRPGVFVPRPETELLVESALQALQPHGRNVSVADIGCGTGAIAIALAHQLPAATVHAVDISSDAVRLAAENARRLGVADRVRVYEGNLLTPLLDARVAHDLDAIVANLPYVPSGEIGSLAPEIRDHEPREALDGGPDGLRQFRRLIRQLRTLQPRRRLVALEVGIGQAQAVQHVRNRDLDCSHIHVRRDYAGIERIVLARLHGCGECGVQQGAEPSCLRESC